MIARLGHSLRRMSFRRQQVLFFSTVVVLALAIILVAIGTNAATTQAFDRNTKGYLAVHDLRTSLSRIHIAIESYVRTSSEETYAIIEELRPEIGDRWAVLRSLRFADLESRFEMGATAAGLRAYEETAVRTIAEYRADSGAFAFSVAYLDRLHGYLDSYLERLLSLRLDRGQDELTSARRRQRVIQTLAVAGTVVVVFLLIGVSFLFARSVSRPLERVAFEAHALAGGDFDRELLEVPESAELREVALAFNRMTESIRGLLRDLRDKHALERQLDQQALQTTRMERLVREAQLVALQSQVNPHFLFNTLNSIARTARVEHAEQSESIIRDLARVLRYILRNPRERVTLNDELRMVGDYLRIQEVRFGERLAINIDADPAASSAILPPLVLQPLVENAVIHGIEPKEEGGTVSVSTRCDSEDGSVHIRVVDDGVGMNPEVVADLIGGDAVTPTDSTDRIGVLNVRARLGLVFGHDHSFRIETNPGEGTVVEIVVPRDQS